ncbi:MAG: hypothetical protein ACOX8R_10270 [Bacillota bacterium]|jgi:protein arginine kinase activator
MLCEKCGSKPAVMKIYENINGEKKTQYICEDCAMEMMGSHLSFGGFDPFSVFAGLTGEKSRSVAEGTVCPTCGLTFRRFLDWGKFGCADCYEAFGDQLTPIFKKLHYDTAYTGKRPGASPARLRERPAKADPRERWEQELKDAVAREDYERAAELKKKIDESGEGDQK